MSIRNDPSSFRSIRFFATIFSLAPCARTTPSIVAFAKTGERLWWARGVSVGPAVLPLISGDYVYTLEPVLDELQSDDPTMVVLPVKLFHRTVVVSVPRYVVKLVIASV